MYDRELGEFSMRTWVRTLISMTTQPYLSILTLLILGSTTLRSPFYTDHFYQTQVSYCYDNILSWCIMQVETSTYLRSAIFLDTNIICSNSLNAAIIVIQHLAMGHEDKFKTKNKNIPFWYMLRWLWPFNSLQWLTCNFSLSYPYVIQQTGNENNQTDQEEVVKLIISCISKNSGRDSYYEWQLTSLAAYPGYISTPNASACSPSQRTTFPRRTM